MSRYLLDCLGANIQDEEHVHSGFEAAWELAAWLKHLRAIEGTEKIISRVVRDLENLYRRSDPETRNRIETGALEHILEDKKLRKYFSHWRDDPELSSAYELCLEWGKAHESVTAAQLAVAAATILASALGYLVGRAAERPVRWTSE